MSGPGATAGARPLREWESLFRDEAGPAFRALAEMYGTDRARLRKKADFVREAFGLFASTFGTDADVLLVRSAGRINLIGMHVDHRGGAVNPIAIRETWFVCQPRDDDLLDCACRRSQAFPRQTFSIREELGPDQIADWDRWTQTRADRRKADGTIADWINYVKAAALYMEHTGAGSDSAIPPIRGMNVLVAGTVPLGAGLSSSSSIVVGTAEALIRINRREISDRDLVDFCGQAEWYVGTRGGAGDHAAIKFSRRGHVAHLGSHPLTVDAVPFPDDCAVVLCNSLVEAKKTGGARDAFNNRIASYEFGLMLLQDRVPEFAPQMRQLRDVNPQTLGVNEAEICRMLLRLPERMTRDEVLAALPEREDRVLHIFGSHAEPADGYRVRQVCAFGIAECARSRLAADALRRGDVAAFGEIVNVSHNGDRVTRLDENGDRVAVSNALPDDQLGRRIADLESGDPARAGCAALWRIPGGYDVSLPELDIIVDAALETPGVVAARVVGAGLGGSVHVVTHTDHVEQVIDRITKSYYEPRGLDPAAAVYTPVAGSGVLDI